MSVRLISISAHNINTEIGILFYEPELARNSSEHFDQYIDKIAFRVELVTDVNGNGNGNESMRWTGVDSNNNKVVFDTEPYAGFWKRLGVNMMRILPIDAML